MYASSITLSIEHKVCEMRGFQRHMYIPFTLIQQLTLYHILSSSSASSAAASASPSYSSCPKRGEKEQQQQQQQQKCSFVAKSHT